MTSVFITVLNMSLMASFVAIGVMLIRLPLKKAPKIYSYALWAIVLFKLLCPFTIETPFSLSPIKAEPVPQDIIYAQNPFIDSGISFMDNSLNRFLAGTFTPASSTAGDAYESGDSPADNSTLAGNAPMSGHTLSDSSLTNANSPANGSSPAGANSLQETLLYLSFIWLAGLALLLLYSSFSYFRLKYRLRIATPLRRNVFETDRIKTAFVLGYIHPKIYLPLGLSQQELDYILKHEETHIRRRDNYIKLLAFLALCLHWFNPVVWLSYFLAMKDMELSCDEKVLKSYGRDIRRDYSNSLLELSARQSGLISPLSFGETGVKTRIKNVLNYKEPALWVSVAAIVVVIATAVILLPNAGPEIGQDIGQETAGQSTGIGEDSPGSVPESNSQHPNELFPGITEDSQLREEMFDFAIQYRFDYMPFFAEENPPQKSAEYLFYAFAVNLDNWGDDKGTMSKSYVEDVIYRHFPVKDIIHEPLPQAWNYDGEKYISVPQGLKEKPIYLLADLKTSTKNGRTFYEAEMYRCQPAAGYLFTDEELGDIKKGIGRGDYSLVQPLDKETFTYYFNDSGEPVFVSHVMTERPLMKWYYQMFRNDPGFLVLGSASGEISDHQMATYAILRMGESYSYENGNSREEYNAITQKYFGRNIQNFDNGATETIPGTDRIRATGWSFDSTTLVLPKDIRDNGDGTLTGDFYCLNIPDSYWFHIDEGNNINIRDAFKEAEEAFLKGDISSFVEANCFLTLRRVVYEIQTGEDGKQYFKYHRVQNLEDNIKSITLYSM